jgi:site-specific recombinase XerD
MSRSSLRRFGEHGVLYVRWGKAAKGSAPKRRSVLTVFDWSTQVVSEWLGGYLRDLFDTAAASSSLWPSERTSRLALGALGDRFAHYRTEIGLPPELGLHCLRHSYVTHLIEGGYDPLFVQQQVGHSYASTTALYTNPRELHQTSENLQVAWPAWLGNGDPRTWQACA